VKGFRFLEHTADALFEAFGENLSELFENSAKAMCTVMYNPEKVEGKTKLTVEAEGKNPEELLHNLLDSILFELHAKELAFSKIRVLELDEGRNYAKAELEGEEFDAERHEPRSEIKAVTWNQFSVKKEGNKWVSRVLLDI